MIGLRDINNVIRFWIFQQKSARPVNKSCSGSTWRRRCAAAEVTVATVDVRVAALWAGVADTRCRGAVLTVASRSHSLYRPCRPGRCRPACGRSACPARRPRPRWPTRRAACTRRPYTGTRHRFGHGRTPFPSGHWRPSAWVRRTAGSWPSPRCPRRPRNYSTWPVLKRNLPLYIRNIIASSSLCTLVQIVDIWGGGQNLILPEFKS